MSTRRIELGQAGEREAEASLTEHGLKMIERNYRCRSGEIDLVMLDPTAHDAEVLVFVEVRLRGSGAYVSALDSIDRSKQSRLISAARHFLMSHPEWERHPCRFDVVALSPESNQLVWLSHAFE